MTNLEMMFMHRVPALLDDIAERLDTRTLAAIMFGQALVNKSSYYANTASIAQRAVEFADALVNELNNKTED